MTDQETLIAALSDSHRYPHATDGIEVVETHISWVLLAGEFAYKVKKAVNLGFLDFSTLEKRRFYCEEELRLNQRLAEGLYLKVVTIGGAANDPVLDGSGEAIEYAVKMRRFDQRMQLDHVAARGELSDALIDRLATRVSAFHESIARAPADTRFGDPDNIWQPVAENFSQIDGTLHEARLRNQLDRLRHWSEQQHASLTDDFVRRKQQGFIRECHGDMHLGNIALFDNEVVVFDGIEFSENLRWIDVISEIAFLIMDLQDRGQDRLAQRFLNAYLERTGDYAGVKLLRFYQVYRAMVRAKVDAIRLSQHDLSAEAQQQVHGDLDGYLALAESYTKPASPLLIINHGVSGSGKTYYSQRVLEALPAIRLRSDVERRRLFTPSGTSGIDQGRYRPEASEQVYAHLCALAEKLLGAGHTVIVDATFLKHAQRIPFQALAERLAIPYVILHYSAEPDTLRQRVQQRAREQNDASEATVEVLEHQLANYQELDRIEQRCTTTVDTGQPVDFKALLETLQRKAALHD
jgi:aminoglycoside phosphotransferase family enzyme/predicted kinase